MTPIKRVLHTAALVTLVTSLGCSHNSENHHDHDDNHHAGDENQHAGDAGDVNHHAGDSGGVNHHDGDAEDNHTHGDAGHDDASVDLGNDAGISDAAMAYCECMLVTCHDEFHARWGEADVEAIANCGAFASALPEAGSAQMSGESIECYQHHCDEAGAGASTCEDALGAACM